LVSNFDKVLHGRLFWIETSDQVNFSSQAIVVDYDYVKKFVSLLGGNGHNLSCDEAVFFYY